MPTPFFLADLANVLSMNGATYETRVVAAYRIVCEELAREEPSETNRKRFEAARRQHEQHLHGTKACP